MINYFKKIIIRLKKDFAQNKIYKNYIQIQHERSLGKYKQEDKNNIEKNRKDEFNKLIGKHYDFLNCKLALVVGCRNSYESDLLENKGVTEVIGIDLFSFDKRIKVIDIWGEPLLLDTTLT